MWWYNLLKSTVFQTIISGIIIFIVGQLFIEYVLKPLQRYNLLRAKAAYCITFYGNRYDLSMPISQDTSEELRKMAAELSSFAIEKPVIIFTIKRKYLKSAASQFVGLSNAVNNNPNYDFINEHVSKIKELLKLL